MWRHIDSWRPAAADLGVRIVGPAEVALAAGKIINADVLFPDFGPRNGMLVVENYGQVEPYKRDLLEAGYGYSIFAVSRQGECYAAEDLAEMLADWTWNGRPEDRPAWLQSPRRDV